MDTALGRHVQADRLGDLGAAVAGQPFFAQRFVASVDAVVGRVFGRLGDQVADVVQQGGHDQFVARAFVLGVISGLQRVLQLRDWLADVGVVAAGGEQLANLVDDVHRPVPSP